MNTIPFHHPLAVLRTITETHVRVGVVPHSDPSLRYALPIPRGWGRVTTLAAEPSPCRAEVLGAFSPKPNLDGPRVIVSVSRLRWEVDPIAWVRYGWERAGWSVATASWLEQPRTGRFEIGAMRADTTGTEVRRCTGFIDSGRLIRIDAVAPLPQWDRMHDALWPAGVLMQLAKPTGRATVEGRLRRGGPRVSLAVPESWRLRDGPSPCEGVHRWAAAPTDPMQGSVVLCLDVSPWTPTGPRPTEERALRVKHELRARGVHVARHGEPVELRDAAEIDGLVDAKGYAAEDREEPFELRLVHVDRDGWSLDYATLVASPERSPIDLLRTNRALEIALHSTQTRPKERTDAA